VFQKLVSHNEDIKRLVEKGFAVAFDSNYLIIRDIPYLDNTKQLQIGAFVTKLLFIDNEHVKQEDHQIFFAGSVPHNIDGTPIPNLSGGATTLVLSEASNDVVVQRSFSNKPKTNGQFIDFKDFYEKIESYFNIIAGPAIELYNYNPFTFRCMTDSNSDSIFKFHDTMTSRAEITDLSAKFKDDVIAVIGVGGTGAYILDFMVKTQVREIRIYDLDYFYVHNAFRSPGKIDEKELNKKKVEVYKSRYENFRTGLVTEPKFIDASCDSEFDGVSFAFVCVDKGTSRKSIFDILISKNIPFIDVGMGLNRKHNSLNGLLRTTYYSVENNTKVRDKKFAEESDNQNDLYRTNIQIGELNALNACLAVIRYKQLRGFYFEDNASFNLLFEIGDLKIVEESKLVED